MDNISPAVPVNTEKSWNELTPQEFQRMLSSWFQEKGIVQDMKSYLKFQMINVLKNTAIGKSMRKSASQTYTLAQQALHLVVAEYLLYYQCHFALSLFSTEVNLANVLPEAKLFFDPQNLSKETSCRFDKENLVNILELVGIAKGSQYFSLIFNDYFTNGNYSLLHCLLGLIGKGSGQPIENDDLKIDFEKKDFMENVHQALQLSSLPLETKNHLLHNLKACYDSKFKTYETQVVQLVNRFKKELHSHEHKLHQAQRRRRALEKRLSKLQKDNQTLKDQLDEKLFNSERIIEKPVPMPCSLCHCNEECSNAKRQCDVLKKEIERLQSINTKQKEEIERLTLNCNDLRREFNSCQSKISLVSSRLQEEAIYDQDLRLTASKDRGSSLSLSSDSLTEEILNEARRKLKLLEEESEELDIRFNQFVIK